MKTIFSAFATKKIKVNSEKKDFLMIHRGLELGPSVREASALTIKPRGILVRLRSIALYMPCYVTRRSLGTKVEPNIIFARSDDSLR